MSSPLEKFVQENREEFDAETPDPRVWEKINERVKSRNLKRQYLFVPCLLNAGCRCAASVAVIGSDCYPLLFPASRLKRRETVAETNPTQIGYK